MITNFKNVNEIKNIYYINLDSRPDRKSHFEKQMQLIGLSATRFNAIKHSIGAIGCSMSHLKCLQIAKERNWSHVFICEDDILFLNPNLLKENLAKFLRLDTYTRILHHEFNHQFAASVVFVVHCH